MIRALLKTFESCTSGRFEHVGKGEVKDIPFEGVCIDSRNWKEGQLFVALKGEKQDGHEFILQLYDKGCRHFLIEEGYDRTDLMGSECLIVENSLIAMGKMAKAYLDSLNVLKIAVTGSMGKTTTRNFIYSVLSKKYKVGAPIKNYNSQTGVPLTIFNYDRSVKIALIEMGLEYKGDIKYLADLVRPQMAVITSSAATHIETMGSEDAIYNEKLSVCSFFNEDNCLIINEFSPNLSKKKLADVPFEVYSVGCEGSDLIVRNMVEQEGHLEFDVVYAGEHRHIRLDMVGIHNCYNAAMAILVALKIGMNIDEAIEGLAEMTKEAHRMDMFKVGSLNVIDDCYSSFPEALESSMMTLVNTKSQNARTVAILGGMNGLAERSVELHHEAGVKAASLGIDVLITIGEKAKDIGAGYLKQTTNMGSKCQYHHFDTKNEAIRYLDGLLKPIDSVLIKGSRIFALEEIVAAIKELDK